jgi:hypothetical protein
VGKQQKQQEEAEESGGHQQGSLHGCARGVTA